MVIAICCRLKLWNFGSCRQFLFMHMVGAQNFEVICSCAVPTVTCNVGTDMAVVFVDLV